MTATRPVTQLPVADALAASAHGISEQGWLPAHRPGTRPLPGQHHQRTTIQPGDQMSDEQFVTPDSATRCASTQLPMTWDGGRWVHQDGACDDTNHFMHPEPALEVHELGEDGDCWIVVGTTAETHLPLVRIAVAKWLVETCGVEDGTAVEIIRDLSSIMTFYQYRDDWAYVPVHAEHPDDESYLRYGKDAPESVQRFAGTRVRL